MPTSLPTLPESPAGRPKRIRKPAKFAAYILRTCDADLSSYDGFQWPESGHVFAPDWKATEQCGNGLHGFLWGEGDGSLANFEPDAKWIVAGVKEWIDLDGKVKFPEAWVVHCGDRLSAIEFIRGLGAKGAVVGGTATAGDGGTATAGYRGTATAGDGGTATAGYRGTATAGYRGIIVLRYHDGNRYRLIEGYVGEDNIKAGTKYCVRNGKLAEVAQ